MMVGLGFLVMLVLLVVGITALVATTTRHRHGEHAPPVTPGETSTRDVARRTPSTGRLGADLDRWVAAGLLDTAQAAAIADHERAMRHARTTAAHTATPTAAAPVTAAPPRTHRRIPVVAEALGYIGGILGTVGVTLLVQRSWADIGRTSHLAIAAGASVALVVAGALVHEARDPALARLRWALWLAATATAGVFGWVVAHEVLEVDTGELEALTIAAIVAVLATALWWNRPRPLQQVVALAAALVAFGSLVGEIAGGLAGGTVVWTAGALMVLAGIGLATSIPALTVGVGAAGTMIGGFIVASDREGIGLPLVCLTAAALLTLAIVRRPVVRENQRVVLTVFGIITLVQGAPQTIVWFARDAGIVTGAVVWSIGLAAVATAIRRRVRAAIALEVLGGLVMLVGAAVTGVQSEAVATLAGVATAIGFVGLGTVPGRVLMSVTGSVGLLAFVPWTIAHFFPGEGRAPLLILVSGALLVGVAVLLTRQGKRFRAELTEPRTPTDPSDSIDSTDSTDSTDPTVSEGGGVGVDAEEHPAERLVQTR